ncbi:hypothetical protein ONZ51_g7618 [Trametes cubensis]|uniref:Uncharacterized protein n=1 Tax=Trametes cubensis TaxID=1111947 RepID=A0AAD7X789_9APHY|nr:hypothetical protein ONZ51_g7618 [Trametes cubensis]
MPSLPSLPAFDDSADPQTTVDEGDSEEDMQIASPIHSTPVVLSQAASTIRAPSSTSSTARFALSLASRSSKSSLSASRSAGPSYPRDVSFDISAIPSLPNVHDDHQDDMDIRSSDQETEDSSVPEAYLPPTMDDNLDPELDLSDALQSVSRSNSPGLGDRDTPRKKDYDYSVSLRSEPKVCDSRPDGLAETHKCGSHLRLTNCETSPSADPSPVPGHLHSHGQRRRPPPLPRTLRREAPVDGNVQIPTPL